MPNVKQIAQKNGNVFQEIFRAVKRASLQQLLGSRLYAAAQQHLVHDGLDVNTAA